MGYGAGINSIFQKSKEINSEILNSYWRHGFYIFEDVFNAEELKDLEADFENILNPSFEIANPNN